MWGMTDVMGKPGEYKAAIESTHLLFDEALAAFEDSDGEVTEDIEKLEAFRDLSLAETVAKLGGLMLGCDYGLKSVELERERIDRVEKQLKGKRKFAELKILWLLIRAEKKKLSHGTITATVKLGRQSVAHDVECPLDFMPTTVIRVKPATVVPESRELDKVAAMKLLKAGEKIPGLSIVRGDSGISIK